MKVRLGIFGKKSRGLRQRFFGLIAGAAARMKILSPGFILEAGERRKALPASERESRSVHFPNHQRGLIIYFLRACLHCGPTIEHKRLLLSVYG